jgi:hypothetical protein
VFIEFQNTTGTAFKDFQIQAFFPTKHNGTACCAASFMRPTTRFRPKPTSCGSTILPLPWHLCKPAGGIRSNSHWTS